MTTRCVSVHLQPCHDISKYKKLFNLTTKEKYFATLNVCHCYATVCLIETKLNTSCQTEHELNGLHSSGR